MNRTDRYLDRKVYSTGLWKADLLIILSLFAVLFAWPVFQHLTNIRAAQAAATVAEPAKPVVPWSWAPSQHSWSVDERGMSSPPDIDHPLARRPATR